MPKLYISWLTDGDQGLNKTVRISESEYKRLQKERGFPHQIDTCGDDEHLWDKKKPHITDRKALFGEGQDKDNGQRADCSLMIY